MVDEFHKIKQRFLEMKAEKEYLSRQYEEKRERHNKWSSRYENSLLSRTIVQEAARRTQAQLEYHISNLVTTALHSISFDENYDFQAEFVNRRGKTECDLWLVKNGERISPVDADSGGVCDIVSLALRLSYWSLKKNRETFWLDEPLHFLSSNFHQEASEMLSMICNELGIQIIMVSHAKGIISNADKVITL